MRVYDLIWQLQNIADKFGDCEVGIANDKNDILDVFEVDRVCFFKDGEEQVAIIVED